MSSVTVGSSRSMHPHPLGNAEYHEEVPVEILDEEATSDVTRSGLSPPQKSGGGVALGILATAAVIFALEWAQGLVISLLLGVIFAYTLNPVVVWLERIKVPRVVGAGIVMVAVVCAIVFGAYSLRGQMQTYLNSVAGTREQVIRRAGQHAKSCRTTICRKYKMQRAIWRKPPVPAPVFLRAPSRAPHMSSSMRRHSSLATSSGWAPRAFWGSRSSGHGGIPGVLSAAGRRHLQA